ncbi:MAG: arginine--tRNA ligase [Synergistaceae bacterium]|nr:arginine--tRNA ligase [Synergistaceae bacterium]
MDFKRNIAEAIGKCIEIGADELADLIEIPPDSSMGDFAFPCFKLAKQLRKAPPAIAAELCSSIKLPQGVRDAKALGGYLNFTVDPNAFARAALESALAEGENYGASDEGNGKTVCIDYSSINIAKPFHIGHLSSTVIGHSLYRIYNFLGYRCVGINHMGDWGTQFGKLIVAFLRWGDKEAVEKEKIRALLELYVRFHDEAEKDDTLNDEARAWFKKIEDGDEQALSIFEWFKKLTLEEIGRVYDLLGIRFDSYAGESFYNDKMGRVVDELRQKGLLKFDKGAYLVDLEEFKMPPCIILRSDGASLYATRDIAAALYRKDTYDFYKCLYVVAYQQNLHFKQWFKVVELMGYEWAKDLEHVAFGMVSMAEGTLSTRRGKVVFLEEVLEAAVQKTFDLILEKSPELENKELVAKQVGVGAVVWNALYNNRIKDVVFSWDKALNFDGETGPYVQYTHARCCSVLRKGEDIGAQIGEIDYGALEDAESMALLKAIAAFPDAVREAAERYEPYLVSRSVIDVCSAFNKFYYDHRIMEADPAVRRARLALTRAARNAIAAGLNLLGIEATQKM